MLMAREREDSFFSVSQRRDTFLSNMCSNTGMNNFLSKENIQ